MLCHLRVNRLIRRLTSATVSGISRWSGVVAGACRREAAGGSGVGGGDGGHGQGGHGQHEVTQQRRVGSDLGMVQAEGGFPTWKSSSTGQRRPAILMRVRSVTGRSSDAKHR
jgi:hypothetical protein